MVTPIEQRQAEAEAKVLAKARKQLEDEAKEKELKAKSQRILVDKLGYREETRMVMQEVVVGKGDHGPIVTRKEVPTKVAGLQSGLNLEEAKKLEGVEWRKIDENQWTCRAEGNSGCRRFVITADVYAELTKDND